MTKANEMCIVGTFSYKYELMNILIKALLKNDLKKVDYQVRIKHAWKWH